MIITLNRHAYFGWLKASATPRQLSTVFFNEAAICCFLSVFVDASVFSISLTSK